MNHSITLHVISSYVRGGGVDTLQAGPLWSDCAAHCVARVRKCDIIGGAEWEEAAIMPEAPLESVAGGTEIDTVFDAVIAGAGFAGLYMLHPKPSPRRGSPSVLSNMGVSIEQHVDWIADCLVYLREQSLGTIKATLDAESAWVAHFNEVAHYTLFPLANSWYMGANIPAKPRVFMPYIGGVGIYRQKCEEVAAKGYEGFAFSAPSVVAQEGLA